MRCPHSQASFFFAGLLFPFVIFPAPIVLCHKIGSRPPCYNYYRINPFAKSTIFAIFFRRCGFFVWRRKNGVIMRFFSVVRGGDVCLWQVHRPPKSPLDFRRRTGAVEVLTPRRLPHFRNSSISVGVKSAFRGLSVYSRR